LESIVPVAAESLPGTPVGGESVGAEAVPAEPLEEKPTPETQHAGPA
jgi:hypothetical protein